MHSIYDESEMEFGPGHVFDEIIYSISNNKFFFIMTMIASYLIWKILMTFYQVINSTSGIHYVNTERTPLKMSTCYNPFVFDVNVQKASYSGIECTLKAEKDCYVFGIWGVPIYLLFELLNQSWYNLKKSIITHAQEEKFSCKCLCSNDPCLLVAGEEKTIEFKPQWDVEEVFFKSNVTHTRQVYPFVIIMTLVNEVDLKQSCVSAMANVVHVPDKVLKLPSQLLGQYVKLTSGPVGLIKKIYLSSPATSSNEEETIDLCLACYHRAVSLVLLPCCHACLCSVCFEFCETCPICRGPANFYFELLTVPQQ